MNNANEHMILAACTGDIEAFKFALKKGADINFNEGESIKQATNSGDVEMVELILDSAGDVNQPKDGQYGTPLFFAALKGDVPMLNCLLQRGANRYELAIGAAVRSGKTISLKTLKAHGAHIQAEVMDIEKALIGRYYTAVQYLAEKGTDDTQFLALLNLDKNGTQEAQEALNQIMYATDYLPSKNLSDRLQAANLGHILQGIAKRELNKRLHERLSHRTKGMIRKI